VPKISTVVKSGLTSWQRPGVLTETNSVIDNRQPLQATRSRDVDSHITDVRHDRVGGKMYGGILANRQCAVCIYVKL
jgi:hypothetical protein